MKNIFFAIIACLTLLSCQPRIEMDMGQWGDQALITNVDIVKLEINDEAKLQEYYNNETPIATIGVRNIVISDGTAQIDNGGYVAKVKLKSGETLDYSALRIYHKGTMVTPINDSPKAGIITNLNARTFTYRVSSADGTKHDWTIIIE